MIIRPRKAIRESYWNYFNSMFNLIQSCIIFRNILDYIVAITFLKLRVINFQYENNTRTFYQSTEFKFFQYILLPFRQTFHWFDSLNTKEFCRFIRRIFEIFGSTKNILSIRYSRKYLVIPWIIFKSMIFYSFIAPVKGFLNNKISLDI